VRLSKLTISEFAIIAIKDNLTINWVSYFISRPKYKQICLKNQVLNS